MNFFKSVFAEDPDPSDSDEPQKPKEKLETHYEEEEEGQTSNPNVESSDSSSSNAWSFGGLMKTLATRSESVIQTYKRDLEEFGSGLKKETAVIREVASRAVKDLPASIEVGASVAQESLESVGQAIDDFGNTVWKGTAEIISHGKESILAVDLDNSDLSNDNVNNSREQFGSSKKYSRFDMQLRAIQCDESIYTEEPEDAEVYNKWKDGFVIGDMGEEIMGLIGENEVMEGIYKRIVPSVVDYERFWSRYFYRVYKLKQAEDARAKLVKRAISGDYEEEDLSWDFEDDEDENDGYVSKGNSVSEKEVVVEKDGGEETNVEGSQAEQGSEREKSDGEILAVSKKDDVVVKKVSLEGKSDLPEANSSNTEVKIAEKIAEGKTEQGESCKDSDVSVVSSQPSLPEEEDLGWDEIEDVASGDESKTAASGSPLKVDLRKRLSAAEEEEDLSWDIEDDDDEPDKS